MSWPSEPLVAKEAVDRTAQPAAFDGVAPRYDLEFTERPLACTLRQRVWQRLEGAFAAGSRVLDLGCGTGEDAARLAQRGVQVEAWDASAQMLRVAEAKAAARGLAEHVAFRRLDLNATAELEAALSRLGALDGAYSDFGALNCVSEPQQLARLLAPRMTPGARLILVVMGPVCALELALFLAQGKPRSALRRWRRRAEGALREGAASLELSYPSPRRLRHRLAPWFQQVHLEGLGVVLPPSDLARRLERHPRVLAALARWDRRLGRFPPSAWLADHYLAVFQRSALEDGSAKGA